MKLSKKIFWISLLISIITIIISVYIEFFSEKNQQLTFISNIVQNVFSGTSVLTITSLYEYWSIKKETFDEIIEEVNIMKDRFSKIQFSIFITIFINFGNFIIIRITICK